MNTTRRDAIRILAALPALTASSAALAQDEPRPIVELDKPVYLSGERIRFWIGVSSRDPIPREKQKGGQVHIVRPDGVEDVHATSWPADGMIDRGWKGGHGLGDSPVLTGRYRFWFVWDDKKSSEMEFTVKNWDLEDKLVTRWTFEGDDFHDAVATLSVENHTDRLLRFPRLGNMDCGVWLSYVQTGTTPAQANLIYPDSQLREPGGDYSLAEEPAWKFLDMTPRIAVPPNDRFTQTLPLANVKLPFPFTAPEIRIATTLWLFVGAVSDAESALYPVKRVVTATYDKRRQNTAADFRRSRSTLPPHR